MVRGALKTAETAKTSKTQGVGEWGPGTLAVPPARERPGREMRLARRLAREGGRACASKARAALAKTRIAEGAARGVLAGATGPLGRDDATCENALVKGLAFRACVPLRLLRPPDRILLPVFSARAQLLAVQAERRCRCVIWLMACDAGVRTLAASRWERMRGQRHVGERTWIPRDGASSTAIGRTAATSAEGGEAFQLVRSPIAGRDCPACFSFYRYRCHMVAIKILAVTCSVSRWQSVLDRVHYSYKFLCDVVA